MAAPRHKLCILLPTGIVDVPLVVLDGRTPLEVAHTPGLDRLAHEGRLGLVRQVPDGLRTASDTALLSVLGYDVRRTPIARGALEAAGVGVPLASGDVAFRMNFVSTYEGRVVDPQAGRIGSVEARLLVEALQRQLGGPTPDAPWERVTFHAGVSYRNLLVLRHAGDVRITTVPPHEVRGQLVAEHLPYGPEADALRELVVHAAEVLAGHDVNRVRIDLGENPADAIWPWGGGERAPMEPFSLRADRTLSVVAGVPIMKGLGRVVGARVPDVAGATGSYDTDYAAKLRATLDALAIHDIVLLHLGAANEACHDADARKKVGVLEEIDLHVVAPLLSALAARGDTRVLLTTDHMTSVLESQGATTHVPFALWGPGVLGRGANGFSEAEAAKGDLVVDEGHTLLAFAGR